METDGINIFTAKFSFMGQIWGTGKQKADTIRDNWQLMEKCFSSILGVISCRELR